MSDQNILDVSRSRAVEQEVLDLLDEPEVKSPNKRQSTSITSAILDWVYTVDYRNGGEYISPPWVDSLFSPLSSFRGVLAPRLRS